MAGLSAPVAVPTGDPVPEAMVRWAMLGLALLIVQNVLGIFVNLFVVLPTPESFVKLFTSPPVLGLHVVNGFLLVGVAAYLVILGRRSARFALFRWSVAGLLFTILALQEGFAFAFTQNNGFSFGMELGFLGAVVADVAILYLGGRDRPRDLSAWGAQDSSPARQSSP